MRIERISVAMSAVLLLGATVASAGQHEPHPNATDVTSLGITESCQRASRQAVEIINGLNVRLESVRQTNNPTQMRAAFDDLQTALGSVQAQLSDCGSSVPGEGAAMSGMPGMDHSKMDHSQMAMAMAPASGSASPANETVSTPASGVQITFKSDPVKLKIGENRFDVTLMSADHKPITNADVSVLFVMPAMPAMNMSEMRNEVKLKSAGSGRYSASGPVMMAGTWTVTVTATQNGKQIAQKKMTLTAQ